MEDTSLQTKLVELSAKVDENNKILKAMRRDALIGGIIKTLIWVGLIGASYYFTMQFLEPYMGLLNGAQGGGGQDFSALFEQYKKMMGQ